VFPPPGPPPSGAFWGGGGPARPPPAGAALVAAGFLAHTASIALACRELGGGEFLALRGGLGLAGWAAAGIFVLVERAYRVPSAGAFVLPLVLVATIPAALGGVAAGGPVPAIVRLPALKLHVTTALAGVAIFAIACGVALMYLLQEREVRGKRFGALFPRLPPLGLMDDLNRRLLRAGFAVFTIALVSGAIVAKQAWGSFWQWDGKQVASLVVWLAYGALVHLGRAGVHGRRAALGTAAGLALVLASMFGLRAAPGLTRHAGDYAVTEATAGD
jgi:ABC-type transport system involved in cytochrome c biogenesis permease subunit